jgi:hypothetical protein
MNIHDSGYKLLFSYLLFFQQLVETFVEEPWVKRLDFSRAVRLDKSFVSAAYEQSEADLLYQVPLKGSQQAIYFYLLIEFQSTVPRLMALRVGQYLLHAQAELQRIRNQVTVLPQIFPLVLYNGKERWTAPTRLRELVEEVVEVGEYGIDLRYLAIIENEYSLERLLKEANLVATLFLAEAHYDRERIIQQLVRLYEQSEPRAVSALANWFRQMIVHKRIPSEDWHWLERTYRSKEELQTMIVEAIRQAEEEIARKSKDEGIRIGKDEGIRIGKDEGRHERDRQHVQRMHGQGYAAPLIAEVLGLSEAEVHGLLREANTNTPPAQAGEAH